MSLSRWFFSITFAAALVFNNWLLGIILNTRLFLAGGSVSEFSAGGQPHAALFRALDILAGALIVALGGLVYRYRSHDGGWRGIAVCLIILGLANCADALLPLPCSGTLDTTCSAPVHISLHRISLPDHALSSLVIAAAYVLIPALAIAHKSVRRFKFISIVTLSLTALFFVFLGLESIFENGLIDHLAGYFQELQMLAFGWWLIALAGQISRQATRKQSAGGDD